MNRNAFKLNPGAKVSSRTDFTDRGHTKYGDNLVGDFIDTPAYMGPVIASGGTTLSYTANGKTYTSRTFTGSGSLKITRGGNIGYLVVAGGGSGGPFGLGASGPGGGGGMLNSDNQSFGVYGKSIPKAGTSYVVTVGGQASPSHIGSANQSFYIHTTAGGTGGYGPGYPGGSGGGASSNSEGFNGPCGHGGGGIGGQGHPGGGGHCHNQCGYAPHGGGGGAGGAGALGGAGGPRPSTVYDGTSRNYAGGGGSHGDGGPCYPSTSPAGGEYGMGNYQAGVVIIAHRA